MIHPSIFNTTPNHAARWHDRSVSSLSARTIYCSQTASDRKTTNKYYLLPYGTIKHCKCMQSFFSLHFLPLPTQSTFIFFFFSLEEPLFFIFILEPLVFRCSKCCNIFSPQIKCEVLTSSKKMNTPYCSILTSKGNHIKDSWGCYVHLLRQSLGNRLFKLPLQISGGVRNGKKWTPKKRSTVQVDSISLTIYHLHFLGCAFFTNCYFWDIRHILQFLSTRFPFRQFKMVKLSNQI